MSKIIEKISSSIAQIVEKSVDTNKVIYSPFIFLEEISLEKLSEKNNQTK